MVMMPVMVMALAMINWTVSVSEWGLCEFANFAIVSIRVTFFFLLFHNPQPGNIQSVVSLVPGRASLVGATTMQNIVNRGDAVVSMPQMLVFSSDSSCDLCEPSSASHPWQEAQILGYEWRAAWDCATQLAPSRIVARLRSEHCVARITSELVQNITNSP